MQWFEGEVVPHGVLDVVPWVAQELDKLPEHYETIFGNVVSLAADLTRAEREAKRRQRYEKLVLEPVEHDRMVHSG